MPSPRRYYRATVSVVPLDPTSNGLLVAMPDHDSVRVLPLDASLAEQAEGSDMLIFVTGETRSVAAQPMIDEAHAARAAGLLVAAVVLGPAAAFHERDDQERAGLAFLREAVDTLVMVRDERILADLLEVLRGGSRDAVA
jgi:hypothetical protein